MSLKDRDIDSYNCQDKMALLFETKTVSSYFKNNTNW